MYPVGRVANQSKCVGGTYSKNMHNFIYLTEQVYPYGPIYAIITICPEGYNARDKLPLFQVRNY